MKKSKVKRLLQAYGQDARTQWERANRLDAELEQVKADNAAAYQAKGDAYLALQTAKGQIEAMHKTIAEQSAELLTQSDTLLKYEAQIQALQERNHMLDCLNTDLEIRKRQASSQGVLVHEGLKRVIERIEVWRATLIKTNNELRAPLLQLADPNKDPRAIQLAAGISRLEVYDAVLRELRLIGVKL